MDTVEITELEKIEADRVDGVGTPANGIPILMMKAVVAPAVAVKGARDCPKCDKSYDADHKGNKCSNCGADLPDGDDDDASKASGPPPWHAAAVALAKLAAGGALKLDAAWPVLKAVAADGTVDEQPDIDGGKQAIALIAKLIQYEAQELEAGCLGEVCDIQTLCCAADALRCWLNGESDVQTGNVEPASVLMQSALKGDCGPWVYVADEMAKDSREFSADERKKHAASGNALPDGSYPIPDKDALRRAAILARSGHGDVAAAKKLIARRAKELGVSNPLDTDDDTSKSGIAKEAAAVDTETQGNDSQFAKAVEDAIAKATAPLEERIAAAEAANKALSGELAEVKAKPIPGGPMMSPVRPLKTAADDGESPAAKAARYEETAKTLSDPDAADKYLRLAAQERAKITES